MCGNGGINTLEANDAESKYTEPVRVSTLPFSDVDEDLT
nr:MAG TPA: hypothetical protein [Caudoviricetes sp.]